jgi:putative DNA primase/helicase
MTMTDLRINLPVHGDWNARSLGDHILGIGSSVQTVSVADSTAPNLLISMVGDARSIETSDTTPEDVVTGIRTGRWRQPVENIRRQFGRAMRESNGDRKMAKLSVDTEKKKLPGVLWSGSFSRRDGDALRRHSGLIVADLDGLGARLPEVRACLVESPHLYACFLSPTADGLKAIFRVSADPEKHLESWRAVQDHVAELAKVQIDQSGKDVSRLCFVSFDPDVFLNRNAVELAPAPSAPQPKSLPIEAETEIATRQRIADQLLGEIQWIDETSGYCICPGRHLHTTQDGERDTKIHLDGIPTLHCFHGHCQGILDALNRELRSRIARAQRKGDDRLTAKEQPGKEKDRLQGSAVDFPEVEPWPEPVDGAAVLTEVADVFRRYVALPPGAAEAVALWCAHAHVFEVFQCSPRLNISSPEKGCGKTTLRDVVSLLVPRAILAENLTVSVLFRLVDKFRPVILADEYDRWLKDNEELLGLLNSGHRRGGKAYRCVGDSHDVRGFNAYAPAVLCGIGVLPTTLHDRSIHVRLQRAKMGEIQQRFDSRLTGLEQELCRKLARWCADNFRQLETADPELPYGVFNRLADNWRPLFAVAKVAADDWPRRCQAAFLKLTRPDDAEAETIGTALLLDIQKIFDEREIDRILSRDLVQALCEMGDRPWFEMHRGKPINERWLARKLGPFNIHPKTLRTVGDRGKGYEKGDFEEVFERYTSGQLIGDTVTGEAIPSAPSVTTSSPVTDLKLPAPEGMSPCHGQNTPRSDNPLVSEALKLFNGRIVHQSTATDQLDLFASRR